jgi:predicted O-methyltransferase YrrM
MTHLLLWRLGLAPAETQTTEAERSCLAAHARNRDQLVEIGVWHGVTTRRLRSVMSGDGELWAVDPYRVGQLGFSAPQIIARREVGKERNGSVRWVRQTGVEAAGMRISEGAMPVDFIFIDGNHSYEGLRADWEAWRPLVAPGGIVALHDSCSSATRRIEEAGSVVFTREVVLRDPGYEFLEAVDTLTILRRSAAEGATLAS